MIFSAWKGGRAAAALLVLAAGLTLPAAAAPASGGSAQVLISAQETDIPQESLQLAIFRRDGSGAFQQADTLSFTTPVNRVTRDVQLHLTPQTDGTALTVDYLTDLNGDGVYELLDGGEEPVYDRLTANGSLASASSGIAPVLAAGSTYTLTADTLLDRGSAAVTDRASGGSVSYLPGLTVSNRAPESILYMVTVSDGSGGELCYYLRLYDQLPAPSAADYLDVPRDAWYYSAVDFAVSNGYLSGTSRSQFSPQEPLTRAMLAQVLYQAAGRPPRGRSHWAGVAEGAWGVTAGRRATKQGIMSGSTASTFDPERPPARQELATALYRFAQHQDWNTQARADLSAYADAGETAPWARTAMEWAVASGLLAGHSEGGLMYLSPSASVTRAEFSAVLQTMCQTFLPSP